MEESFSATLNYTVRVIEQYGTRTKKYQQINEIELRAMN